VDELDVGEPRLSERERALAVAARERFVSSAVPQASWALTSGWSTTPWYSVPAT
jgi:hypothetical protein